MKNVITRNVKSENWVGTELIKFSVDNREFVSFNIPIKIIFNERGAWKRVNKRLFLYPWDELRETFIKTRTMVDKQSEKGYWLRKINEH